MGIRPPRSYRSEETEEDKQTHKQGQIFADGDVCHVDKSTGNVLEQSSPVEFSARV